jgi:hypothetical protein
LRREAGFTEKAAGATLQQIGRARAPTPNSEEPEKKIFEVFHVQIEPARMSSARFRNRARLALIPFPRHPNRFWQHARRAGAIFVALQRISRLRQGCRARISPVTIEAARSV